MINRRDQCLFQAILGYVKSEGLTTLLKNDKHAKWFIQRVLALPLLPHDKIALQFRVLKGELSEYLKDRFKRFTTYFERYWLKIIKPKNFSVFGLQHRTNNAIEAYHASLLRKLEIHPTAWAFFCKQVVYKQIKKNCYQYKILNFQFAL